jgi:hypothetical protein
MDYNENQNLNEQVDYNREENSLDLKEKTSNGKSLWWWVILILILGLVGWYGYTSGWFAKKTPENINLTESNNDSGHGSIDDFLDKPLAPIDNITIQTGESFPVQKTLVVKGNLPNSCVYLNEPQIIRDGNIFYVNITTRNEGEACTEALVPYERNIGLDVIGLPAGVYTVVINGKQITFELEQDNSIDFTAGSEK